MESNIKTTLYAVEINNENTNDFIRQIDTFSTYEKAVEYIEIRADCGNGEYYNIIIIDYNNNGDEVCSGTVC